MALRCRTAVILLVIAAIGNELAEGQDCRPPSFDVTQKGAKVEMDDNTLTPQGTQQMQCENSTLCRTKEATLSRAACEQRNSGFSILRWSCSWNFYGSGYTVGSYRVTCPNQIGAPCITKDSCEFHYTPQAASQPVAVISGVGGTVSLLIFCGICYWCCCRKKKVVEREVIRVVHTSRPSPQPSPTPAPAAFNAAAPVSNQNNITLQLVAPAIPPLPGGWGAATQAPSQGGYQPGPTSYPPQGHPPQGHYMPPSGPYNPPQGHPPQGNYMPPSAPYNPNYQP